MPRRGAPHLLAHPRPDLANGRREPERGVQGDPGGGAGGLAYAVEDAAVKVQVYVSIQFGIVRPIKRLTRVIAEVSIGNKTDLDVSHLNPRSANELHLLALATDRVRTSLEMVAARLRAQKMTTP